MIKNLPPANTEYEAYVLGSMIMSKPNRLYAFKELQADDMYLGNHKICFEIISNLENQKIPIDIITIKNRLEDKKIEKLYETLLGLTEQWTGSSIEHYVKELISLSQKRQAISAASDLIKQCYDTNSSFNDNIFTTTNKFKNIIQRQSGDTISLAEFFKGKTAKDLSRKEQYFKTGFSDLDSGIIGLFKGHLVYLAAETSIGKTAFATNIAMNICQQYLDYHVLFFPLEMTVDDMAERIVSQSARVDSFVIKTEKYGDGQQERINQTIKKLESYNNFHLVKNVYTLSGIVRVIKNFLQSRKISIVVIDYMQLVNHSLPRETRERIVADISRTFKQLAAEENINIFAISTFNREISKRKSNEPELSDLKETGAIEYDGNMIFFLYQDDEPEISKNSYFLKIAKNKGGRRRYKIELYYSPEITLFEGL